MIDQQLASFLHDGVGIHLGTRNERLEPNGVRATAARVEDDGVHVIVFVPTIAAARVMPDLESNGFAAVVFGRPTDERACQVKGQFVSARPTRPQERPMVMAHWERFRASLEYIGVPRIGSELWPAWPSVAIRLKVTAIFEQTPGAQAGTQLA